MFVIRQANLEDAPTLLKLAKMVHSNNLPADADILRTKLLRSRESFLGRARSPLDREFVFALEDTDSGNVIGTSSIISCISSPGRPHLYFLVRKREHFSEDLATGHVHVTLQLGADETGPTEIGGLILSPSYRGHKSKLGALLSLIRFHFMGLHRDWFSERIIAEMAAPLTPDSRNTLWEYLGRRFINLEYAEADRFCRQSKEFITSLFPKGEIYATLLPPEARNLIGKVSPEAEPAKIMLEGLGFRYIGHCDPFDGGPYLEARLSDIPLLNNTRRAKLGEPAPHYPLDGFVSFIGSSGFRGVRSNYVQSAAGDVVSIPPEHASLLGAQVGDSIAVTPRHPAASAASSNREASRSTRATLPASTATHRAAS
ncbi:MAG: arginine N-succinyltransferase [Phycisphaerales bacterium]|nr:arginine N-succinyltransferase [Phycisphaerales bacterium]MCI0630560.1 arginine N-succinyltransferase [Phycisphaerales bacterium]MCI0676003.1 arginine N-succinyltransferase [Phycisphaerales bacterium]